MANKKIRLKLDKIISDRNQYKPYIAELSGLNVFVDVEVPDDEANVDTKANRVVLTVDGLAAVLGNVASALENMHEDYRKKKFGH